MKPLEKVVNGVKQLIIFAKTFVVEVWQSARYAFGNDAYCDLNDHFIVTRKKSFTRCSGVLFINFEHVFIF